MSCCGLGADVLPPGSVTFSDAGYLGPPVIDGSKLRPPPEMLAPGSTPGYVGPPIPADSTVGGTDSRSGQSQYLGGHITIEQASTLGNPPQAAPTTGETFWDFLNTSSQYDVGTFASKYQTPLIIAAVLLGGAFMFFGAKRR